MRIYLSSEKLIHKKYILEAERTIKQELFGGVPLEIKMVEKFNLSKQYTASKLLPIYRDSILMELKEYSIFEYNIFRQAKCEFTGDDSMTMTVEKECGDRGEGGGADPHSGKRSFVRDVGCL